MDPKLADVFFNGRPAIEPLPPKEVYRLLRLEFIKAAMQGILSHQNYDFPPEIFAQWAIRHAEATLAAAGEKL